MLFSFIKSLPVTALLVCLSLVCTLLIQINDQIFLALIFPRAEMMQYQEVWRFITPIFLHFSVMHIAFNLAIFYFLAIKLERYFGSWIFLCICIIVGVISNSAQGQYSIFFGGMSGVNYGLISFISLCYYSDRNKYASLYIPPGLIIASLLLITLGFIGIISLLTEVNIANIAHIAGLGSGALCFIAMRAIYLLLNMRNNN